MPGPLSLFVHTPPPVDTPAGPWTRHLSYGDPVPPSLRMVGGDLAEFVMLRSMDPAATVHAAAAGYLSTRSPEDHVPEPDAALPTPLLATDPETVMVYLNPLLILSVYPGFAAHMSLISSDFPTSSSLGNDSTNGVGPAFPHSFVYINLDAAALRAAIQPLLDAATVPLAATSLERDRRWRLFLMGALDAYVTQGQVIGRAGLPSLTGEGAVPRWVGFSVLGAQGTIDPGRFYSHARAFVTETSEGQVDDFLALVPRRWPLEAGLPLAQLMDHLTKTLYPYPVLLEAREIWGLDRTQWRQVGDLQKELYLRRLRQRVGLAPVDDTSPRFVFNDHDRRNLFQLEAVVEFYANFREPRGLKEPIGPTDDLYQPIDLLPPEGSGATVTGTQLDLVDPPEMGDIWPGHDLIRLAADTARDGRTYRILEVDTDNDRLVLDATPDLGSSGSTSWTVLQRPNLVLIDPFGGRLEGTNATVVAGATPPQVELDTNNANVAKVNRHGFDVLYLHDDTAGHDLPRPPRSYAVVGPVADSTRVELAATPTFPAGSSTWHLTSGLGGRLPFLDYTLSLLNQTRGSDHYDGVMFVVYDGEIMDFHRFSSYTSRKPPVMSPPSAPHQHRSSIRGNARYYCTSTTSTTAFLNFSYKVCDKGAMTFDPGNWSFGYDGVRENRFYFEEAVTEDTAADDEDPVDADRDDLTAEARGKTDIRIHRGTWSSTESGTGSAGCVVSPSYFELRRTLIGIARGENQQLTPPAALPEVQEQIAATTRDTQNVLWNRMKQRPAGLDPAEPWEWDFQTPGWDGELCAFLWVIRPEERPIG